MSTYPISIVSCDGHPLEMRHLEIEWCVFQLLGAMDILLAVRELKSEVRIAIMSKVCLLMTILMMMILSFIVLLHVILSLLYAWYRCREKEKSDLRIIPHIPPTVYPSGCSASS